MSKPGKRAIIVAVLGVAAVVTAAGIVLSQSPVFAVGSADRSTLFLVPPGDLANAATTLTQAGAATLVDDAKRCNIPLAVITIAKGTSVAGNVVRVKSGNYVSPYFAVGDQPLRIAIPFPASFGSGAGNLTIEGSANGAMISLLPSRTLSELPGSQTIPVAWRPRSPC